MKGRARLEFDPPSRGLKQVQAMSPVEMFVAKIVDGNNKAATRLMFRIRGDKQFYFLFPNGTEETLKVPAGWCQQQLERLAPMDMAAGFSQDDVAVPVGDPE